METSTMRTLAIALLFVATIAGPSYADSDCREIRSSVQRLACWDAQGAMFTSSQEYGVLVNERVFMGNEYCNFHINIDALKLMLAGSDLTIHEARANRRSKQLQDDIEMSEQEFKDNKDAECKSLWNEYGKTYFTSP